MSLSCGFYESLNHDRKYDNTQLSRLFNSLINDGVFENVGNHFVVHAVSGNDITVDTGLAWFNSTFTYNDALLPLTCTAAHVLLDRIDAVVLEVDSTQSVRANAIKMVDGVAASTPVSPTLINTDKIHQYPICYINRAGGSSAITQANITNCIGTDVMPFITGILQTVSLNTLLGQWQAELDEFEADQQAEFITWFNSMKDQLSEDAAGQLQEEINAMSASVSDATTLANNALTNANKAIKAAGIWLNGFTITKNSTAYTYKNSNIKSTSMIDIYYADGSVATVRTAEPSYAHTNGSLTITFKTALSAAVTVSKVKVVNP